MQKSREVTDKQHLTFAFEEHTIYAEYIKWCIFTELRSFLNFVTVFSQYMCLHNNATKIGE